MTTLEHAQALVERYELDPWGIDPDLYKAAVMYVERRKGEQDESDLQGISVE